MTKLRVVVLLLALTSGNVTAAPVHLAPTLGDTGGTAVGPTLFWPQTTGPASIASNGDSYFAVWTDSRYGSADVFGTKIGADGTVINPHGIPITPTYASDLDPAIVRHGSGYLVAYTTTLGVFLVSLSADGEVLDGGLIPGTQQPAPDVGNTAIATNGTDIIVAWTEFDRFVPLQTAYYTVADASRHIKVSRQPIPRLFGAQQNVAVASSGGGFVFCWTENDFTSRREVFSLALGATEPTAIRQLSSSPPPSRIALGATAFGYLVATGGDSLQIQQLDFTGRPNAPPRELGTDGRERLDPALTPLAGGALLAWTEHPVGADDSTQDDLAMVTLDQAGIPTANVSWISNADDAQQHAAIAANHNDEAFVVWTDRRAGGWTAPGTGELYGRVVSKSGALAPESIVAYSVKEQHRPFVVAGQDGFLVLWTEEGGINTRTAFASLIGDDGAIRRTNITVATTSPVASALWVTAAASDNGYLVAWWGQEGILATRLTTEGIVVDDPPIRFGPKGAAPSIASDGTDFLVSWTRYEWNQGTMKESVRFSLISSDGTVATEDGYEIACCKSVGPDVAWNGSRYVIAWLERSWKYFGNERGRFVTRSGVPLDPEFTIGEWWIAGAGAIVQGNDVAFVTKGGCWGFIGSDGPHVPEGNACGHGYFNNYVAWTGRTFMIGEGPIAVRNERRGLLAGGRLVRPLPESHEGGVSRIFVSIFDVGRSRSVRR